jgi:SusD/RagB-like outer membrane lipoprotein
MKIKTILFTMVLAGLALTGCKKEWLDINTNPNQLPLSSPNFVFTSGVNRTAAFLDPNEIGSYWSGQWTQSSTYIISGTNFQYIINNSNFNFWDTWYDILYDFQYVLDNADELEQPFMKGPAHVMKAYIYQQVVDTYGNVPYFGALQGDGNLLPKFDNQQAIYEDLIKVLDTAITELKANPFNALGTTADIVFKGNTTSWIRFANSLKMRILIRQSRVAGRSAYIIGEINKAAAVTEGFLTPGLDVTANPGFLGSAGKTNPIYDKWGYNATGATQALGRYPRPTDFLFNTLKATDDTFRLKRLFYPVGGESAVSGVPVAQDIVANYKSVPFGASSGYLSQNTSPLGPALIARGVFNKPVILMEAAESFFLLAEAKELYGSAVTLPSTSQDYYQQGVRESFRLVGSTDARATALLTSGKDLADWNASPNKLNAIRNQKWLALVDFGGFEAWSDYRRTGYPAIPKSASAASDAKAPVRLYYPSTEAASNATNVLEQGTVDIFNGRLFWDVD